MSDFKMGDSNKDPTYICFVCLRINDNLKIVFPNATEKELLTQIEYVFPEIKVCESKNNVYICSSCHTTLHYFCTFKKKSLENYIQLKNRKVIHDTSVTRDIMFSDMYVKTIINNKVFVKRKQGVNVSNSNKTQEHETPKVQMETSVHTNELVKQNQNVIQNTTETEKPKQQKKIDKLLHQLKTTNSRSILITTETEKQKLRKLLEQINLRKRRQHMKRDQRTKVLLNNNQENNRSSLLQKLLSDHQYYQKTDEINIREEVSDNANQKMEFESLESETVSDDLHVANCEDNTFDKDENKLSTYILNNICPTCNKRFSTMTLFESHIIAHLGIKNYECDLCKQKFSRKLTLKEHVKIVHFGTSDFLCPICGKAFAQKRLLTMHINSHNGVKEHACSICNKRFTRYTNMKYHEKIHKGIKDFACTICPGTFSRKIYLINHLKNIHSDL